LPLETSMPGVCSPRGAEVGLRGDDVAVHPGAAGLPAGLHGADTGVILAGSLLLPGHPAAGVT
jgi:hypothetical protein